MPDFRPPSSNDTTPSAGVVVHLIDGTYELFRHFYGLRRFKKGEDRPFGAVIGVLNTVLQMIETRATHVGVATDHVIESFREEVGVDQNEISNRRMNATAFLILGSVFGFMTNCRSGCTARCAPSCAR